MSLSAVSLSEILARRDWENPVITSLNRLDAHRRLPAGATKSARAMTALRLRASY